jgi:hypothetical protein
MPKISNYFVKIRNSYNPIIKNETKLATKYQVIWKLDLWVQVGTKSSTKNV